MNKYVIAYSFVSENEIEICKVEGTSKREAVLKFAREHLDMEFSEQEYMEMEDLDTVLDKLYDMDLVVAVSEN